MTHVISATVQSRAPYFWDKDDTMFLMEDGFEWNPVPWRSRDACTDEFSEREHCETMCWECIESWAIDHHVRLTFDDRFLEYEYVGKVIESMNFVGLVDARRPNPEEAIEVLVDGENVQFDPMAVAS